MTQAKHTQGPWGVMRNDKAMALIARTNSAKHSIKIIAHIDPEIKGADLSLILAAPELLEAVQGLMLWVMDESIAAKKEGRKIGPYEAARAALAKARGQS